VLDSRLGSGELDQDFGGVGRILGYGNAQVAHTNKFAELGA
jgi:hypothetical protein